MATKVRVQMLRVNSGNRSSITPLTGEFLYETDTGFVYIGDGTTAGGNLVSSGGGSVVSSVNGETGVVVLEAEDIPRAAGGGLSSTDVEAALIELLGIINEPERRQFVINGGSSNLPANGTEQFSWGHNNTNDGLVMLRDGEIVGHTLQVQPVGTAGSVSGTLVVNGTNQTALGEQIILDGNVGVDGETVSRARGLLELGSPIQYNAGDLIHYRGITSGWSPTSSDCSATIFFRDR